MRRRREEGTEWVFGRDRTETALLCMCTCLQVRVAFGLCCYRLGDFATATFAFKRCVSHRSTLPVYKERHGYAHPVYANLHIL
jgi:hypothetical protein